MLLTTNFYESRNILSCTSARFVIFFHFYFNDKLIVTCVRYTRPINYRFIGIFTVKYMPIHIYIYMSIDIFISWWSFIPISLLRLRIKNMRWLKFNVPHEHTSKLYYWIIRAVQLYKMEICKIAVKKYMSQSPMNTYIAKHSYTIHLFIYIHDSNTTKRIISICRVTKWWTD